MFSCLSLRTAPQSLLPLLPGALLALTLVVAPACTSESEPQEPAETETPAAPTSRPANQSRSLDGDAPRAASGHQRMNLNQMRERNKRVGNSPYDAMGRSKEDKDKDKNDGDSR